LHYFYKKISEFLIFGFLAALTPTSAPYVAYRRP